MDHGHGSWHGPLVLAVLLAAGSGCSGASTVATEEAPPGTGVLPLTDLGVGVYLGFPGGLYPDGASDPPADHAAAGLAAVRGIGPRGASGEADPTGKIVLLSVGMSNTTQEFCSGPVDACAPWSFVGQASVDPAVNRETLVIVDGARGGHPAEDWDSLTDPVYDFVQDARLAPMGVTEAQVQIVWIKQANPRPTVSLPDPGADAYRLEASLGDIVRALAARYPNLQLVFLSSRTYGGHATTPLNPEPYAYETGFAVKWLVEAQIEQTRSGRIDPEAGDLSLDRLPWLGWGPYLWADGENPRADGLVWRREDFVSDGTHPSRSGEEKVGRLLLEFFKASPFSRCWFLAGRDC